MSLELLPGGGSLDAGAWSRQLLAGAWSRQQVIRKVFSPGAVQNFALELEWLAGSSRQPGPEGPLAAREPPVLGGQGGDAEGGHGASRSVVADHGGLAPHREATPRGARNRREESSPSRPPIFAAGKWPPKARGLSRLHKRVSQTPHHDLRLCSRAGLTGTRHATIPNKRPEKFPLMLPAKTNKRGSDSEEAGSRRRAAPSSSRR